MSWLPYPAWCFPIMHRPVINLSALRGRLVQKNLRNFMTSSREPFMTTLRNAQPFIGFKNIFTRDTKDIGNAIVFNCNARKILFRNREFNAF